MGSTTTMRTTDAVSRPYELFDYFENGHLDNFPSLLYSKSLNLSLKSFLSGDVCPAHMRLLNGLNSGCVPWDLPNLAPFCLTIAILTRQLAKQGNPLSSEGKFGPSRGPVRAGRAQGRRSHRENTGNGALGEQSGDRIGDRLVLR